MSKIVAGSNIDQDLKSTHDALKPRTRNGKINDAFNPTFLRNNEHVKEKEESKANRRKSHLY